MIKTLYRLVALAALLSTAAQAQAQSSVTIYGSVDEYAELTNAGHGTVKRLSSGGAIGSRLGFRGNEDLGGGLKALFDLENDFFADTGSTVSSTRFFNRQAYVGLASNDYGSVLMGRQYTPYFSAMAQSDPANFYMGSALNYFAFPGFTVSPGKPASGINGTLGDATTRRDNAVSYISPVVKGFTAKVLTNASEGTDALVRVAALGYSSPTLFGSVAYLTERTTYIANNTDRYGLVQVGYDFGVVKSSAIVVSRRGQNSNAPDIDGYQLGASAPFGPGVLIGTVAKLKNRTNDAYGARAYGVRYDYLLSKRTKLYAGVTGIDNNALAEFTINGGASSSPGVPVSAPGKDPHSGYFGVSHTF